MSNYLLLLAVVPIVVGVFLVNYLGESTLEKQILPTYSAVTLGATDTEIILQKTNAILSENEELQTRVTLIQSESEFQTSELGKQITVLQEQMKKVEETKSSSIVRAAQLEEQVATLESQINSIKSSSSAGSEILAAEKAELESQLRQKQDELSQLSAEYQQVQAESEKEKEDFKLQLLQKQEEIDRIATLSDSELAAEKAELESQVSTLQSQIDSLKSSSGDSEILAAEKAELESILNATKLELVGLYDAYSVAQEKALAEKTDLEEQLALQQAELELLSEAGGGSQDQIDRITELELLIASLEESQSDEPDLGFDLLEKIASLESQIIELESRNQTGGSIFDDLSGFTHEVPTVQQPKVPTIIMTEETVTWEFSDSKNNKYSFSKLTDDFIDEVIRLPPPQEVLTITLTGVGPGGSELTQDIRDLSKFVVGNMPSAMNDMRANVPTDDEFIFEVWWIVSQFELTSFEMQDTPKKPLDTFAKGEGDNEDLAILMADMIKSSDVGKTWNVDFIYYDSDNPSGAEKINHVALIVDNSQNTWLIEPTAKTIDAAFESRDRIRGNISHIE